MLPMIRNSFFMPDLIDEFFGRNLQDSLENRFQTNVPAVNIVESDDKFLLEVAAPGLKKEDFRIDIEQNKLTISSEKKHESERSDGGKYCRKEFVYSSFRRAFSLPESVDSDKIIASHSDGILSVSIPKREEAKVKPPRTVKIS